MTNVGDAFEASIGGNTTAVLAQVRQLHAQAAQLQEEEARLVTVRGERIAEEARLRDLTAQSQRQLQISEGLGSRNEAAMRHLVQIWMWLNFNFRPDGTPLDLPSKCPRLGVSWKGLAGRV